MNAKTEVAGGTQERLVKWIGLAVGLVAAVAALLIDGEIELTLFMVAAVVGALATFDAALDRRTKSFGPWMLVSIGIVAKAVPTVLARLGEQVGPSAERSDHLGAILVALCVGAALVAGLSLASKQSRHRTRLLAIAALSALIAAVAFAATAFGGQGGFSSRRVAWILETTGWAAAGLILGTAVLLVGTLRRVSPPLTLLIAGAASVAVLVALTSQGRDYDLGWWALSLSIFTLGTLPFGVPRLALRSGAIETIVPVIVAVLLAVVALQAAIDGLGDDGTWRAGAFVLPLLAIAVLAIGIPMYRSEARKARETSSSDQRSGATGGPLTFETAGDDLKPSMAGPDRALWSPAAAPKRASAFTAALGASPVPDPVAEPVAEVVVAPVAEVVAEPVAEVVVAPVDEVVAEPVAEVVAEPVAEVVVAPVAEVVAEPVAEVVVAPVAEAVAEPVADVVAEPVPAPQTETVPAPVQQLAAADTDPATSLASGPYLQSEILTAFATPPTNDSVAILMVAVRNLEVLENQHGRVASAALLRALAGRFRSAMPNATTARFASNAFAALIVDNDASLQQLIDSSTAVLLELLEPVGIGATVVEVDVAASLAQSKPGEDAQAFVNRANTGLQRAVHTPDPSLVAMP